MKTKKAAFFSAVLMLAFGVAGLARAQQGEQKLGELVEAARADGRLDLMVTTSQGQRGARELAEAFKQRFKLDITINADLSGLENAKIIQAITETKNGLPPTFDLMQAQASHVYNLVVQGGAERVEGWEVLLKEIAPEAYRVRDEVSPDVLRGYGFQWGNRVLALLYNPRLISGADLPKTWKDKVEPKYAGAFSVPPWTGTVIKGILKYDREEWLQIMGGIGRNKRQVLTYAAAVERMLLGELKFVEANTYSYFMEKGKDPSAPIALTYYEDFTPLDKVMYVVRKRARHASAAKLFALWAAGAEANSIFEKYSFTGNLLLGTGPITQKIQAALSERKAKPVSWFDSPGGVAKLKWLATEQGRKYVSAVGKAQREGR